MSEHDTRRCLFCGIAAGTVPSQQVYSDELVMAFRDLHPQAPLHVLVIPRAHIAGINAPEAEDGTLLAALVRAANVVARQAGIAESGYRLVWNVGPHAGQSVFHLHLHVLGGRALGWPPG
ncbi:MAG: histidine triad nucleotide-binding protein [Ktedonobacterales bacterium]|nr:histidine triad nucleotide-binding protein [Ktedonobacterales bacterium]